MRLHELKNAVRIDLKQRRARIPAPERADKGQKIVEKLQKIDDFINARAIFCYISYLSEVDTQALIDTFIERNLKLAVPKIIGETEMLAIRLDNRQDLAADQRGILTPKSDQKATGPFDIAITPGLGFTNKGERLGYGRGYYDRWFANNSVKTKIAIAFELQIIDTLPTEDTDQRLDMIITEERIIDLRK